MIFIGTNPELTAYRLFYPKNNKIYIRLEVQFDESVFPSTKKSIYGLKQSSHLWHQKLKETLIHLNFTQCKSDPCLFFQQSTQSYLLIYVDDILIISHNDFLTSIKQAIAKQFKIRDLGQLKHFLNVQFIISNSEIHLNQSNYIKNILEKFDMSDCKPVNTPMMPIDKNKNKNTEVKPEQTINFPYQEIIGSLIYLTTISRPDICFPVFLLSRFMQFPSP